MKFTKRDLGTSSDSRGSLAKKVNKAIIVGIVIFLTLIFASFVAGGKYETGELQQAVLQASDNNAALLETKSQLKAEVEEKEQEVIIITKEVKEITEKLVEKEEQVAELEDENNELQSNITQANQQAFDAMNIVQGFVSAVCCSFNDIQKGNIITWDTSSDEITCGSGGNYTVDCSTGETNY